VSVYPCVKLPATLLFRILSDVNRHKFYKATTKVPHADVNASKGIGDASIDVQRFERRIQRLEQEKNQLEKRLQGEGSVLLLMEKSSTVMNSGNDVMLCYGDVCAESAFACTCRYVQ